MKIALLLSGQPRFYKPQSYNSIKTQILDKYDTDVFIHCWYSPESVYSYAEWSGISYLTIPNETISDLITMYKPKSILVEPPRTFPEYDIGDYLSQNMPSMWYSLQRANSLRKDWCKTHKPYDFVIRARTDTVLNSFPDLSTVSPDVLYVPDNCPNPQVLNDNFSICGGKIVDKHNVYDIYNNLWEYAEGKDYSPESCWHKHLLKNDVEYKKINFYQTFQRKW